MSNKINQEPTRGATDSLGDKCEGGAARDVRDRVQIHDRARATHMFALE